MSRVAFNPVIPGPDADPSEAVGVSPEWQARARRRMERIDGLSPELRDLVNELGWTIVNNFLIHGVHEPRLIRHLVETVLENGYGNGTGSLARSRAARMGHDINGCREPIRTEAINAFLGAVGVKR